MGNAIDLFLGHNNADKPLTERLASAVEADRSGPSLKVFFDKWDIPPGGDIPIELEEGLQNSLYVGLVLSPESLSSDWVTLERSAAIHRDPRARERSLIPLLRRTCDLPDMLGRLKFIDFRREQDFDQGLDILIGLLRGRPSRRGGELRAEDIYFREDAALHLAPALPWSEEFCGSGDWARDPVIYRLIVAGHARQLRCVHEPTTLRHPSIISYFSLGHRSIDHNRAANEKVAELGPLAKAAGPSCRVESWFKVVVSVWLLPLKG
jgi:TIR domain